MRIFFFLLLVFLSTTLYAQQYQVGEATAKVHGSAPLNSYTGVSSQLSGTVDFSTDQVNFSLPLKTIDTGNKLRNKHMREALEVEKYPRASFEGQLIDSFNPQKDQATEVQVKGQFTIHGESKTITVTGTLESEGKGIFFTTTFDMLITNFGMERPSVLFYTVKDKHTIEVEGKLFPAENQ